MTTGNKQAHKSFASALTTTQPRAIRALLGNADDASGFLNRWVFAAGPEKQRIAIGGAQIDIEPAVDPLKKIQGWAVSFAPDEMMTWSSAALEIFGKFFDNIIQPTKKQAESELIVRVDLLLKKLCLLFSANKMEKEVTEDTVTSVLKMWQYILDCYAIPGGQIGNTFQHEVREAVAYQCRRLTKDDKSSGPSLNEISKALKRKKYPLDILEKTIKLMVTFGEIKSVVANHGKVGRPTERFIYVG